jgi:hypothetical protein
LNHGGYAARARNDPRTQPRGVVIGAEPDRADHAKTVLPTHLDAYGDPAQQPAIAVARRVFADEVRRVSPKTRVILPTWFEPVVLR